MKHWRWLMIAAAVALVLNGCEKQPSINESDLYGYWFNASTNEYMRIMHEEKEMQNGHYLGYEWKVDEKQESDLKDSTSMDYHGNGWFEWSLAGNQLSFIEMMNISSARGAKVYTITLSATSLVMKDSNNQTISYEKSTQPQ